MSKVDYSKTYWNHKGKHPKLHEAIRKLIPDVGEVPNADQNPALERFRLASNCYYDLYNNGLCNMRTEFQEAFGFDAFSVGTPDTIWEHSRYEADEEVETGSVELTQELVNKTEDELNRIIKVAAKEQKISR